MKKRIKSYWETPFDLVDMAVLGAILILACALIHSMTANATNQCTQHHSVTYCERGLN